MVLIITEELDKVSDNLIEWLISTKKLYKRLTYPQKVSIKKLYIDNDIEEVSFIKDDLVVDIESITSVWYRRATLNLTIDDENDISLNSYKEIVDFLKEDQNIIVQSIENIIKEKVIYIGGYTQSTTVNKLNNLLLAKKNGLSIPPTLITSKKSELLSFAEKHGQVITKNINEGISYKDSSFDINTGYTSIIASKDIQQLPEKFGVTLFQKYIKKVIEIRVFFVGEKLFPMAIFSQNDNKTVVDYRQYNDKKPNRNVPFQLPDEISELLLIFAEKSKINTGSFDLILTSENDFVFLEVNPVGQFHWVSEECNYYIEREIAKLL